MWIALQTIHNKGQVWFSLKNNLKKKIRMLSVTILLGVLRVKLKLMFKIKFFLNFLHNILSHIFMKKLWKIFSLLQLVPENFPFKSKFINHTAHTVQLLGQLYMYNILLIKLTLGTLRKFLQQTTYWNIFVLIFSRKQGFTFHANCLQWRQFAWNVKSSFLGKITKLSSICFLLN